MRTKMSARRDFIDRVFREFTSNPNARAILSESEYNRLMKETTNGLVPQKDGSVRKIKVIPAMLNTYSVGTEPID